MVEKYESRAKRRRGYKGAKAVARRRQTAKERHQWTIEREALVGSLITQEGFEGALVTKHVRGSQYLVRLPDGQEVYMSHKKQRGQAHREPLTPAGWKLWEEQQ
jgi:hypothetical protein